MKKVYLLILLIVFIACLNTQSQNLIAVQNNTTPVFYTNLDSAIVYAVDGDTVFLPGGNFPLSNTTIDKLLHIIGVGHHPDSSVSTNPTNIILLGGSGIKLVTGAGGGSLIGLRLYGSNPGIQFGTSSANADVSNFRIGYCYVGEIGMGYSGTHSNLFFCNIIGGSSGNTSNLGYYYNNIITGPVSIGNGSIFKNNIIICDYSYHVYGTSYSTFENNIFKTNGSYFVIYTNNYFNIFRNNLFTDNISFPYGNNSGSNNIIGQIPASIFVNQSGGSYSYTQDYHLQSTCPGKNAGRDGTDIGIYGGAYPWKEGSIPFNPHYQKVVVSPTTNSAGNLNVNIQVEAQQR